MISILQKSSATAKSEGGSSRIDAVLGTVPDVRRRLVHHGAVDSPVKRLRELYADQTDGTHPAHEDSLDRLFERYLEEATAAGMPAETPAGASTGASPRASSAPARRFTDTVRKLARRRSK
jgi:hypothetical protein